jgi:hypothetical protein
VAHGAAALAVLKVMPGASGVMVAMLIAALGVLYVWGRALHRMPSSIKALELGGAQLDIELASGERLSAEASERRYVGRYLVLIPLRTPRRTVLVTRDMADAAAFRRLRIWALWGRLPAVAAGQLAA